MELTTFTQTNLERSVCLSGCSQRSVKSLIGFQKHHRIPDGDEIATQRFLSTVGTADIESDLDAVFSGLKQHLGFKRRELTFAGPIDGSGMISTPAFDYRVQLLPHSEQRDQVVWRRFVDGIRDPDLVMSPPFSSLFGDVFSILNVNLDDRLEIASIIDHVEDAGLADFDLDYNRAATWCEIRISGIPGKMRIDEEQISVSVDGVCEPRILLGTYIAMQQRFTESLNQVSG